jgi:tRNA (cmo5U34)-methyltransferase
MNEFDGRAKGWDSNPIHWERSKAIAEELIGIIPLSSDMNALEYGAGTGILSFMLKDHLGEITLMDSSTEMVKIISEKIENTGVKNFKPMLFDLEHNEFLDYRFDFVYTQMVLHHVDDIESIIKKFHGILKPGGYLAIADLYTEDGSFHGEGFKGHLGFDVDTLAGSLRRNQFTNVLHRQCYIINREVPGQINRQYPVFLLTANRI